MIGMAGFRTLTSVLKMLLRNEQKSFCKTKNFVRSNIGLVHVVTHGTTKSNLCDQLVNEVHLVITFAWHG